MHKAGVRFYDEGKNRHDDRAKEGKGPVAEKRARDAAGNDRNRQRVRKVDGLVGASC